MALGWLKERGTELRKQAGDALKRFQNEKMLDALTGGCAWLASADGSISDDEKRKMLNFMQVSPEMKVFDTKKVLASYKPIADTFEAEFEFGRLEAVRRISKIKGDAAAANVLVRLVIILGSSDGNFDADEKKVVREICGILDIDATQFDL
ncbi:tellurite resistance TerB family protein [Mesorhizobium carmichaelinearum]|uniref:tellurite resistance TerB family protein n=1 Tax=Mesorhizobium carmichaelinearum TaxID=1208188 RepID=UPI000BA33254|nr:TerB family tellurite resistance protein [Mesorhizobium carmichaelinearum]